MRLFNPEAREKEKGKEEGEQSETTGEERETDIDTEETEREQDFQNPGISFQEKAPMT